MTADADAGLGVNMRRNQHGLLQMVVPPCL
jgi:hypothetical protein